MSSDRIHLTVLRQHVRPSFTNSQQVLDTYYNLRYIAIFISCNLILHSMLVVYYATIKYPHIPSVSSTITLISAAVALVGGLLGVVGGLTHCTTATKACLFGFLWMMLFQTYQTFHVLYSAHQVSHVDAHVEGMIIVETILLLIMEGFFIACLSDFIKLCKWHNSMEYCHPDGQEPLLSMEEAMEAKRNTIASEIITMGTPVEMV